VATNAAITHASAIVQPGIVVPPHRTRACIMPIRTWLARPRGWGARCACRDPPMPRSGVGVCPAHSAHTKGKYSQGKEEVEMSLSILKFSRNEVS
jgi:hypothetical protein